MVATSEEVQNKNSTNTLPESTICFYCKTGFLELEALKLHMESFHRGKNPWVCSHCPKKFQNQLKLKFHHRFSHTGEKLWICHKCKKPFKKHSELNRHLFFHTGQKPYKCDICKKGFNQIANLRVHSGVHRRENPYICGFCHERFKHAVEFKKHVQKCFAKAHESSESSFEEEVIVNKEKVRLNELSDEKSESEIQLAKIAHEFSIDGSENFSSNISGDSCTLKPSSSRSLYSPANTNTDNRQNQFGKIETSEISGRNTGDAHSSTNILVVQKKKSTNSFHKSTICTFCKTGFLEAETLKMHIESYHGHKNLWICNHCQKKFQNHLKLNSHHRISHTGEKRWSCHKCKKRFNSRVKLNKHLFIHTGEKPLKCNICKKGFNQIKNLRVHHSRVHGGEKPFICRFCHHRFKYATDFKRHVQKCLPKTHESSESSFGEEKLLKNEDVCFNELSDEKSACEIQVTKNVRGVSNDGSEGLTPKISAEIYAQIPCCSSTLLSPAITTTQNRRDQFGKVWIKGKSSEPEELKRSIDVDTTICSKLSEENRRQEWTSFLKVFNVKVGKKF